MKSQNIRKLLDDPDRGWRTSSIKGQIVNILAFVSQTVCVVATQLQARYCLQVIDGTLPLNQGGWLYDLLLTVQIVFPRNVTARYSLEKSSSKPWIFQCFSLVWALHGWQLLSGMFNSFFNNLDISCLAIKLKKEHTLFFNLKNKIKEQCEK